MVIVGRAVTLTGALSDCDVLVVEGRVDAHISSSRAVEITETGVFRGEGEVEEAIVRGWLDGDLTVSRRLLVRSTGRVTGNIRYRDLQIEHGGRIAGTLLPLDDEA
jgi:cytoskeletal protein CcmA (bactofilin family)